MTVWSGWWTAGAVAVLGTSLACGRGGVAPGAVPAIGPDSVVGIVTGNGTAFEQRVMLRSAGREIALAPTARDSAAFVRIAGTEVVARGKAGANAFQVQAFSVRTVDGQPVADGILVRDGASVALQTAGGRITLGSPPLALAALVGARVWIAGPLESGPTAFGIIIPR